MFAHTMAALVSLKGATQKSHSLLIFGAEEGSQMRRGGGETCKRKTVHLIWLISQDKGRE